MKFEPPVIRHIDDVLPWIKDKPEITHRIKEDFQCLDYVYAAKETFDNPYARECRGLKFDMEGNLIARPYHKFHNLNENPDYHTSMVDLDQPHNILDKLDGSMVHSCRLGGRIRLMTRAGLSEVALKAEAFLRASTGLFKLYMGMQNNPQFTYIFEYVAPHNKIVVHYEEEQLILTGVRNIVTGHYIHYDDLKMIAKYYEVPIVPIVTALKDIKELSETVSGDDNPNQEGVVVRFDTGAMAKIKSDSYVRKHKSKDLCSSFKGLVDLIVNDTLDDVLPQLDEDTKKKVLEYKEGLVELLSITATWTNLEVRSYEHLTQKEFAIEFQNRYKGTKLSLAFGTRKTGDAWTELKRCIQRACSDTTRLTALFEELGLPIWKGGFFDE